MLMRSPIVFADCYSVLLCCLEGKYILRLIWSQGSVIEGEGTILPRDCFEKKHTNSCPGPCISRVWALEALVIDMTW